MNPPIPTKPCVFCGKLTEETQSVYGVAHKLCYEQNSMPNQKPLLDDVATVLGCYVHELIMADWYKHLSLNKHDSIQQKRNAIYNIFCNHYPWLHELNS